MGPAGGVWLTRCPKGKMPYAILENDPLPQRSELAQFGNVLVETPEGAAEHPFGQTRFQYVPGMACTSIDMAEAELRLNLEVETEDQIEELGIDLDMLFSLTGFHPDKELWSEIQ